MRSQTTLPMLLVACLLLPASASAHGGSVSEALSARSVFVPFNSQVEEDALSRLDDVVENGAARNFTIRVALLGQPYDLGSEFELYRKPQRYAEHLGRELVSAYPGRLLVAMPNGFGYVERGKSNPGLARALEGVPPPGRDPTRIAEAATTAVRRLAAAAGRPLPPQDSSSEGSVTRDRVTIVAAVAIGLALIGGVVLIRRLRMQRREAA